ncbi:MAG: glutamine--fructose-6-phosphate transaminase (isomerizing) [Pseudomonadota bacterium]
MCGIVGVIGKHAAAPIILDALRRLEYRGYDSAGIATVHQGKLDRRRAVGKLAALADLLVETPIPGRIGIGHTRWATHGAPNVTNAHPHSAGPVSVVHNGIIENYKDLRRELSAKGAAFATDTDTETVAHLCAQYMSEGLGPREAASKTLGRLEGAFALCFLFDGEEDLLVAARKGSPIALGYGEGEMFVGSDALALAPMTNQICYLEEGDYAFLTADSAEIFTEGGQRANRDVRTVAVDAVLTDKGHHTHFMAKEIHEQPTVSTYTLSNYVDMENNCIAGEVAEVDFSEIDRIVLVACGTAYYACAVAKYWFEQIAGLPVKTDIASEFRYREPPVSRRDMTVFVSQSGETADTLAALKYCKEEAATVVSVINATESSIARLSDHALPILAGTEVGVASTKAFTTQLIVLLSLAIRAARQRGKIDATEEARMVRELRELPRHMNAALALEAQISGPIAQWLSRARDVLFLGRGTLYPIALEGALKLKEISYIHAEGYASGELKHGPIALIDRDVPVIVFAPRDALFGKTVSNMQEVMARDGRVLLVTDAEGAAEVGDGTHATLIMPHTDSIIAPILYALPAQLIAYHTAIQKGTDVDQPRNLAKSVTVE